MNGGGACIVGLAGGERAPAEAAPVGGAATGPGGAWVVSIADKSGRHREARAGDVLRRRGFVGSVSAYEHGPARPTPSRATTLHGSWVAKGGPAYVVSAVRLHRDARGTLLGVMTTHIAATLAPGKDALDGSFTFKAARLDGRVLSRGSDMLHGSRIASRQ